MVDSPRDVRVWPHGALDSNKLRADGWRPTALRQFVLKVHQLCNLACDYCYVYTMADQSWRSRPAVMPAQVRQAAIARIAEHARQHQLDEITVILHGGEPLMAGTATLTAIADDVRAAVDPRTRCRVAVQTNGVLLTEARLTELRRHGIRVAVSIDGGAATHDRHRRHLDDRASFHEVHRAVQMLSGPDFRGVFAGLLCVIDPSTDPVACYRALAAYCPPALDLLLPHANWQTGIAEGVFGPWLVAVFDEYFDQPSKRTAIRLFDELINLHLGGDSWSEHVGLSPIAVAVVESDGDIEQTDALKSAYPDAAATGRSVLTDPFDTVLANPGFMARQLGLRALCPTCQACRLRRVCGGGHYAHRYRPDSGFLNPSVYCADLQILIDHVGQRVERGLRQRWQTRSGRQGGRRIDETPAHYTLP